MFRLVAARVALAVGLALGLLATIALFAPPPPAAADTAGPSARYARDVLATFAAEPHSVMDAAGRARSRDAIVAELRRLGYAPELHTYAIDPADPVDWYMPLSPELVGRRLDNIVVRVGPGTGPSVVVMAHWDSAPVSPPPYDHFAPGESSGAVDAGYGVVAALDVLRQLRDRPEAPAHDLVVVLTDGEEIGEVGARYERALHPETFAGAAAIVNLEGMGPSGTPALFETSVGNAGPVNAYLRGVARPMAFSLTTGIYRLTPIGTDLTAFLHDGHVGLNFAAVGGVETYHQQSDHVDHVDLGVLQWYLDQASGLVLSLLATPDADLAALRGPSDLVFFTIAPGVVVRYSVAVAWALALVAALGLAALAAGAVRSGRTRLSGVLRGTAWLLLPIVVVAALLAGLAALLLRSTGGDMLAVARIPAIAWGLLPAVAALAAADRWVLARVRRRHGAEAAGLSAAALAVLLGIGVTAALPGFSYLFVVPALAAPTALAVRRRRHGWAATVALGVVVTLAVLPSVLLLHSVLTMVGAAITVTLLAPALAVVVEQASAGQDVGHG